MKKIMALVLIVVVLGILIISDYNSTPYSGNYIDTVNNSTSLQLKSNNTFSLNYTSNRDVEQLTGKYSIDNNHINLRYDKADSILYSKIQEGKIEGSRISFTNMDGYFLKNY